jgi:predicted AAA+ superfamily ATPase
MIARNQETNIKSLLFKGKVIILIGPRQVGKTTLIKHIANQSGLDHLFLDADDAVVRQLISQPDTTKLKQIVGNYKLVVIDEAQRISDIGLVAKIMIDQFKDVQLILSGSSSFELTQQLNEPLTGRKFTFHLWPISWNEFEKHVGYVKSEQWLETRLIYGFYPDVIIQDELKERIMKELADSYLFKDVLIYGKIRKPELLNQLLQALAYQCGQEVNYKELSDLIKIDAKTVSQYIELLEKSFVIFKLTSFSRNLRNEIKTSKKLYFYDNGIRNALIGNFDPLNARNDVGQLWENFLVSERLKLNDYNQSNSKMYFWRTKQQQEIDLIEVDRNHIKAFEFKWNPLKKVQIPKTFTNEYGTETSIVNRENFRAFLG